MNIEVFPAVKPYLKFNPIKDAYSLHEAIKIFEAETVINILCCRTNNERQIIRHEYQQKFHRCLIADIKSKAFGNIKEVLCALLTPLLDYRVKIVRNALMGPLVDTAALIEFLCGYNNTDMAALVQIYRRKYKESLEDNIISSTSGQFQRIITWVIEGRKEHELIDYKLAEEDAALLLQAGVFKNIPNEQIIKTVFCRRNYNQIRITDKEYKKITGQTLEYTIKTQFSGNVKEALLAILSASDNRPEYFATALHKSMFGLGTNDKQLIRIMVSRSEIDLLSIKNVFERKYGKPLKSWIKGDTSGYYRDCLLTLIHEKY